MDAVRKKDEACYAKGEPAMHKINLLKRVQEVVQVKDLQATLLDYDILGVFADWLHVKADKSLPSHTVRTAVYVMLNSLPCETTHLKRIPTMSEHSKTIGMVVMELYKHKQETKDNKR